MKLQPALIFGQNMILQRGIPIPVWGRSVRDDTVTVVLNGYTLHTQAKRGEWRVTFQPMEAVEDTSMTIASAATGERIEFGGVAIGEVWIAGGQSNMEFLLKYDEGADEMHNIPQDPMLRYFRYPQTSFLGQLERDAFPDDGFWRKWDSVENRDHFSAPAAYMGHRLRAVLGVPVGFVGCNWGGTPAAAWTAAEELDAVPALQAVLDWHSRACAELDWPKYEADALHPDKDPPPEQREMLDALMMGGSPELLQKQRPPRPPEGFSPFEPGPKAAVRPTGLYENILRRVAPYGVRGVIWYQGEDDDARGWHAFYDESMKALIQSWRRLWKRELPFLQVELAPLHEGLGKALNYAVIREKQRDVMDALPGVHNVCILDAGDARNIHVRKKRPVGERLALLARKYVYGELELLADSPRLCSVGRADSTVSLKFLYSGSGLFWKKTSCRPLYVEADGSMVAPEIDVCEDTVTLHSDIFSKAKQIKVRYCEENYCEAALFNSAGLPAFPFSVCLNR